MDVTLEGIKFNHQANSATNDGFSIRHNETRPVRSPEWKNGAVNTSECSPAAYALDLIDETALFIEAKITWTDTDVKTLNIRSLDGNFYPEKSDSRGLPSLFFKLFRPLVRKAVAANVLGVVASTEITPDSYQPLKLTKVALKQAGIGVNEVVWRWQFSTDGDHWVDFQTTRHRIYSVKCLPVGAWQPNSDKSMDTQLPWTDVLEYACRWAAGATTFEEIATKVTTEVNGLGPRFIKYNESILGSPHYTPNNPPRFDCQRFINLLNGQSQNDKDPNVNCSDCAAIVSSFVTILGYPLQITSMHKPHGDMPLRRHQKIGLTQWEVHKTFNFHTVGWNGGIEDKVSDACLKLDTNSIAQQPSALIAGYLPFGDIGEPFYRHFLVNGSESNCQRSGDPIFRRIGLTIVSAQAPAMSHTQLGRLKQSYRYNDWQAPMPDQARIDLYSSLQTRTEFFGWVILQLRLIPLNWIEVFMSQSNRTLRIDAQVGDSMKDADENLLRLLGTFEMPGMKYHKDAGFGDCVFADESGFVIVFSRSNLVIQIRNITGEPVSLWSFAKKLDIWLTQLNEMDSNIDRSSTHDRTASQRRKDES
jgi:hypothetical protein